MTAALVAALLLDAALGEPRWLWSRLPHPAVLMGRAIAILDRHLNRGPHRRLKGCLALALLLAGALLTGAALAALPGMAAEVIVAAILLAQRSLSDHVRAVARALRVSLGDGRRAVAMIVGRDTAAMDEPAVARAAIESAAENLSDGVTAPAFWFLLGGLPGLVAYKALNTADSMIGHRTPRHEAFGWAAARADDVANWIPARLTALLLWLAAGAPSGWTGFLADARRHRSPNAGWPEAAMARATETALAGPRSYGGKLTDDPFVNPAGDPSPGPARIDAAVALLWRAWALGLATVALSAIFRT
ncbi:adenosylcobinamide-phosphate synthase CbiB [Histidinibacterium lentulum]|uniref:Cobalamin biosynthesis protein CobD n=1 Tax=Histidinibacterium lentulum TaxID=2480588 RepID=A0A3N2R5R3_9RHOB|nr:adenosylcobinamide-phosphate synthase CbiB [Histidinibacterium lentulum]ROU02737.1 cobalamin biosynthesis protein [Histidinibacterium lentulum]